MRTIHFLFALLYATAVAAKSNDAIKYQGTAMIGSSVKATIWFEERDSIVSGAITYAKGRLPILIRGVHERDGNYRILEFQKDGMVSGILTGTIKGTSFNGEWFSPESRKNLLLKCQLRASSIQKAPAVLSTKDASGTFKYAYGKQGHRGFLKVVYTGEDYVTVSFDNTTAAPAYNQAIVDPVTLPIRNNVVFYQMQEGCAFRIRLFQDFAIVDYPTEEYECSFGMNASVDGIYCKAK